MAIPPPVTMSSDTPSGAVVRHDQPPVAKAGAARAEARLPAMIGQNALTRAADAYAALVEARRLIIEAHAALDEARAQIGLKEVNGGDILPKPTPSILGDNDERRPLRVVA